MTESNQGGKTTKILLGVGGGCLLLCLSCCCGIGAFYQMRQSETAELSKDHVERFLDAVQRDDYEGAFAVETYDHGDGFTVGSAEELRRCYEDTALADMTAYECDDVSVEPFDDGGDVQCTVTSTSRGPVEITVHANYVREFPSLGFTWFASRDAFGSTWAGEGCALYSGQSFMGDTPAGRVRP